MEGRLKAAAVVQLVAGILDVLFVSWLSGVFWFTFGGTVSMVAMDCSGRKRNCTCMLAVSSGGLLPVLQPVRGRMERVITARTIPMRALFNGLLRWLVAVCRARFPVADPAWAGRAVPR